jgi:biotin carboxyl carrier protein
MMSDIVRIVLAHQRTRPAMMSDIVRIVLAHQRTRPAILNDSAQPARLHFAVAPRAGRVTGVAVAAGAQVRQGARLMMIEEAEEGGA